MAGRSLQGPGLLLQRSSKPAQPQGTPVKPQVQRRNNQEALRKRCLGMPVVARAVAARPSSLQLKALLQGLQWQQLQAVQVHWLPLHLCKRVAAESAVIGTY